MKITYFIDYLYSINGGTEKQLYLLIKGMISRGHEVEVYILRHTEFTKSLSRFPCPIYCLGINSIFSKKSFYILRKFKKLLIAKKVDVVHGFFNDVALILPPLMAFTGIRSYTSRRDMGIWYTRANLFFLRIFRGTKTKLICNSLAVAKMTHEMEWKPKDLIRVIYNGIDSSPICDFENPCNWIPKRKNNSNIIYVVLVANVRSVKKIEDLIMAAILLRDWQLRFQYYVVGYLQEKYYCDMLHKLLRYYRLEDHFHFTGLVAEPRYGLPFFDIGVLTSKSEGLSNTIMEYMDAGLPVIASNVGGNPELVINGINGFLYEPGDYEALAVYLETLASNIKLRSSFSAGSKKLVRKFDIGAMLENYAKEYEFI